MKETVVSFEIAKKLQEKGYDWQTFDWYSPFGDFSVGMLPRTLQGCPMRRECYAPTIGLALKWLREVKNIYVDISLHYDGWDSLILTNISTDDNGEYVYECVDRGEFPCPTYEQAAMEGIAYCLDHII